MRSTRNRRILTDTPVWLSGIHVVTRGAGAGAGKRPRGQAQLLAAPATPLTRVGAVLQRRIVDLYGKHIR